MQETKSADNQTTLLHHFVTVLQENYPATLNFFDEMTSIEVARRG